MMNKLEALFEGKSEDKEVDESKPYGMEDDTSSSPEAVYVSSLQDALGVDEAKAQAIYDVLCGIVKSEKAGMGDSDEESGPPKKKDLAIILDGE